MRTATYVWLVFALLAAAYSITQRDVTATCAFLLAAVAAWTLIDGRRRFDRITDEDGDGGDE